MIMLRSYFLGWENAKAGHVMGAMPKAFLIGASDAEVLERVLYIRQRRARQGDAPIYGPGAASISSGSQLPDKGQYNVSNENRTGVTMSNTLSRLDYPVAPRELEDLGLIVIPSSGCWLERPPRTESHPHALACHWRESTDIHYDLECSLSFGSSFAASTYSEDVAQR